MKQKQNMTPRHYLVCRGCPWPPSPTWWCGWWWLVLLSAHTQNYNMEKINWPKEAWVYHNLISCSLESLFCLPPTSHIMYQENSSWRSIQSFFYQYSSNICLAVSCPPVDVDLMSCLKWLSYWPMLGLHWLPLVRSLLDVALDQSSKSWWTREWS